MGRLAALVTVCSDSFHEAKLGNSGCLVVQLSFLSDLQMSRAGREPAEDLKRRLVAACQEVGLTVRSANMFLLKDRNVRVINVDAIPEDWPHESPMASVMANITINGQWDGNVDVRCCATDDNPLFGTTPWMKGRFKIALAELVDQLRETLDEREKVIAAIKCGIDGPYRFKRSVWEVPDLLKGMNLDGLK